MLKMNRLVLTCGVILAPSTMSSAHAGYWDAVPAAGPNGSATTNASLKFTAPADLPNTRYKVRYDPSVDDADGNPMSAGDREVTVEYTWTWIPDGTLANDPAPATNATHVFAIENGPVKATWNGNGRADARAYLSAGYSQGQLVASYQNGPSPQTATPFTGEQSQTLYSGSQAVQLQGNQLRVFARVGARSSSFVEVRANGSGKTEFNDVDITTKRVTLLAAPNQGQGGDDG